MRGILNHLVQEHQILTSVLLEGIFPVSQCLS
jgi:hypothetical protein